MRRMRSLTAIAVIGAMILGMGALPTAAAYDPCDVNRDGRVSIQDSIYVNRYLMGYFYLSDPSVLDATGNDVIDAADSACVLAALTDSDFANPFVPLDAGTQTASVNATGVTKNRDYVVYNFDSDTETGNYTLTLPEGEGTSARTLNGVIGEDDREPYVNSGIVKLLTTYTDLNGQTRYGVGTGFVVGDHTIATAAHCVYVKNKNADRLIYGNGSFATNIIVQIYDENRNICRTVDAIEGHVFEEYQSCEDINKHKYDYALISVSEDLSSCEHFKLGEVLNSAEYSTVTPVYVAGYPGLLEDGNGNNIASDGGLYIADGTFAGFTNYRVDYFVDSSGGTSGGPAFVNCSYQIGEDAADAVYYKTVFAIHTASGTNANGGVRMTPELMRFYLNNPYNTYEE